MESDKDSGADLVLRSGRPAFGTWEFWSWIPPAGLVNRRCGRDPVMYQVKYHEYIRVTRFCAR